MIKWLSITWTTISTIKSNINPLFKLVMSNSYKVIIGVFYEPFHDRYRYFYELFNGHY